MKLSIYGSTHGASVRSAESNTCYHITALILYPGFMHYNPQERDFLKKLTDYNMTVTFCHWTFGIHWSRRSPDLPEWIT